MADDQPSLDLGPRHEPRDADADSTTSENKRWAYYAHQKSRDVIAGLERPPLLDWYTDNQCDSEDLMMAIGDLASEIRSECKSAGRTDHRVANALANPTIQRRAMDHGALSSKLIASPIGSTKICIGSLYPWQMTETMATTH